MTTNIKAGGLAVEMIYCGAPLLLAVRNVTMRDEEAIEEAYPIAQVPMTAGEGQKSPDFANRDYIIASRRIDRNRKVARVALALLPGNDTVDGWLSGADTLPAKVERLKDVLQEWQADHLHAVIRNPRLVTEEDVQREMQDLLPTSAAATEAD